MPRRFLRRGPRSPLPQIPFHLAPDLHEVLLRGGGDQRRPSPCTFDDSAPPTHHLGLPADDGAGGSEPRQPHEGVRLPVLAAEAFLSFCSLLLVHLPRQASATDSLYAGGGFFLGQRDPDPPNIFLACRFPAGGLPELHHGSHERLRSLGDGGFHGGFHTGRDARPHTLLQLRADLLNPGLRWLGVGEVSGPLRDVITEECASGLCRLFRLLRAGLGQCHRIT
mmetsp:Transcript_750/g.1623  ORF Transcript_750/g.1623 Transcript_750/m.1623 type:complete len:223 (+) Transcript_750:1909-2577(+)